MRPMKILKNKKIIVILFIFSGFFYSFSQYTTITVTIPSSSDAQIRSGSNRNYGNCDYMGVGVNGAYRSLVYFNLSSIPSNATITNAYVTLTAISGSNSGNRDISMYRITSDWVEGGGCDQTGSVNWNSRMSGQNWSSSGGDYSSVISTTTVSGTYYVPYTWDLTQTAQYWHNGIYTNYGVIFIQPNENHYKVFATKEHTNSDYHPFITISYSIPTASPGGIASQLRFWVKANEGVTITSGAVSQWNDQSGNNRHLYQNTSSNRPTRLENGQNFNPTVRFNASNTQFFQRNSNFNIFAGSYSIYLVGYNTSGQRSFITVNESGGSSIASGIHIEANDPNTMRFLHRYPLSTGGGDNLVLSTDLNNSSGNVMSFYRNTNTKHKFILNGIDNYSLSPNSSQFSNNEVTDLTVGQLGSENNRYLNGEIAEIIIYNRDNESDRLRIESYLALKYGISLNNGIGVNYVASNNTTFWNRSTNSGYNHDVFGIGRDDQSALHQKQSQTTESDPFFTIYHLNSDSDPLPTTNELNTSTIPVNRSFLVFGNNDGDITQWFRYPETPVSIISRVERIWKVQKTGTINNVTLTVDTSDLPANTGTLPIYLLVSSTPDMTNAEYVPMTLSGSIWRVAYNFSTNTYISFGYGFVSQPMRHGKAVINGELIPYK